MLIVRTPVRISFAGGGTDFPSYYEKHGGMVLSTSIDKYFYTVLTEREDNQIQVISSDLKALESCEEIERMEFLGNDLEIPFAVLKYAGFKGGANLFLASEVPPGTGLGSSAAVCVNLLKTVTVFMGRELAEQDLAEAAFHVGNQLLKKPVGKQDEYACSVGGVNVLRFSASGVDVEPLRLPQEMLSDLEQSLMLFFTGSSRNSSDILAAQDRSVKQKEENVVEALNGLKKMVPKMRDALLSGSLTTFGRLMHESWQIKKRVSAKISNPLIDQVYDVAIDRGALGGKITGAGGGGFLLLVCEKENQENVRTGLGEFGLKEMKFHFDLTGTRVVYNDPFFDSNSRGGLRWIFTESLNEWAR